MNAKVAAEEISKAQARFNTRPTGEDKALAARFLEDAKAAIRRHSFDTAVKLCKLV